MTLLWTEIPARKRRKSPRALRFGEIKVGDQLVLRPKDGWYRKIPAYFVVTDLWFDPVAGEIDETAGRMVAIKRIGDDGEPKGRKQPHTIRGLASQGFHYADVDFIAQRKATIAAAADGSVIGIGRGRIIRARPKLPGRSL